ncbi:universal stress protein [Coralloluteibacterium stylophorae]|nr:universal stress protein [Coralloluteibacterium stylophorae]
MSMATETVPTGAGCVLAAIDRSAYTESVCAHAAWAASRLGAPLEFLHLPDRRQPAAPSVDWSGSIGVDAQMELLRELAELDERRNAISQQQGEQLLAEAAALAQGRYGIAAATRQRHGSLTENLDALQPDVRLFVMGKRGEHADFDRGHLGGNLERVARAVQRPLLVAARAFQEIARFAIAYDGSPAARRAVEMVAASPLLRGLPGDVVTVGEARGEGGQDWARETLAARGFEIACHRLEGAREEALAAHVERAGIGLLVMGAWGHGRVRNLFVGSTTTEVLRACRIPVLLLR